MIAVDLKGSLSSFSNLETTEVSTDLSWDGQVELHNNVVSSRGTFPEASEESSSQSNLEETVKVWSDFLRPTLHERSIHLLSDYQHENTTEPFDVFPLGRNWWSKEENREEIENLIRTFSEECDYLQVTLKTNLWKFMC